MKPDSGGVMIWACFTSVGPEHLGSPLYAKAF